MSRLASGMAALVLLASLAPPAAAETVDCGNGNYCPAGYACLVGGTCGQLIDVPRGSTKTSTGGFCEPGYVEHRYRPGACAPTSYQQCKNGFACPPGSTCTENGQCEGLEANGPACGNTRCIAGRVCSSKNTCINPDLIQDCGNGKTLCTKAAACQEPRGCVYVAPERIPQTKKE
ncbi:MAG: hypothetical protein AB7O46_15125 [Xanthobacteraceae bacterium]|nr:hypothetical protein [Xanthobacteraceae bacterium]